MKNAKAEELLKRQASGEKLTDEEYQEVSNYIEQTKEIYSEIRFKINNIFDSNVFLKYLKSSLFDN